MSVVALVTLYYPDEKVADNMKKLSFQVDRLVLLDNTPNKNNAHLFNNLDVKYIPNLENLGLSSAFNTGLRYIKDNPCDFVIFFDQDSSVNKSHVEKLIEDYNLLSSDFKIGALGPAYYDSNSKKIVKNKDEVYLKEGLFSVKSLITSSLLIRFEVLEDISGWNESVFLDYADWDLCWRLLKKNYILVLDSNITLNHTLGDSSINILNFSFPKYSPVREYYRIRDSIKIMFKDYVPFKYRLKFLYTWIIEPFIYLILFPNRLSRVKLIFKAFKDAIRNINGPIH